MTAADSNGAALTARRPLAMNFAIATLPNRVNATDLAGLCALLRDAIESGASVGFLQPVNDAELAAFWRSVVTDVRRERRVVLVAREAGRIVGTVQLEFAAKPNASHRAELQKLLVLRSHRGRGLGAALLAAAEQAAAARGRSLLVLDTSVTGNALGLYARCGYTRAGVIPRYAQDPDGPLIDTAIYYKELRLAGRAERRPGVLELRPA
jgi:ribosomal protein S18 acetylase RimI-like enzyme